MHSASESDFTFFGISGLNPDLKDSLNSIEEYLKDDKILKYIQVFISDEMINMLVLFTNIKAENNDNSPHTWRPTNWQEMKKFICLSFFMGISYKPTIQSYWSTSDPLLTPFFFKEESLTKDISPYLLFFKIL